MLQAGALIRDVTRAGAARDDGRAPPAPARSRRGARARRPRRTSPTGAPRSCPAVRPSACGSRSRSSRTPPVLILDEPTVGMDVEARRAFWLSVRAFAGAREDDHLRHPLPRGGRRLRRSRGPDVPRPDRRRRPDERDQGPGGHAHDPRHAAGRRLDRLWLRCPGVTAADRRGESIVLICTDSDAAIRALLEAYPDATRHRDRQRRARGRVHRAHRANHDDDSAAAERQEALV